MDQNTYEVNTIILTTSNKRNRTSSTLYKIILIIISCILMFCSSLTVSTSITNKLFQKPLLSSVTSAFNTFVEITNNEKESYISCIDVQLDRCNKTLYTNLNNELNRVNTQMDYNKQQIDKMEQIINEDTNIVNNIVLQIQEYTNQFKVSIPYNENICTQTEKDEIMKIIDENDSTRVDAYHSVKEYSTVVNLTLTSFISSYQKRVDYDINYFNLKKISLQNWNITFSKELQLQMDQLFDTIKGIDMEQLMYCLLLSSECQDPNSMYNIVLRIRNFSENQYNIMSAQYMMITNNIKEYNRQVDALLSQIKIIFDQITALHDQLLSINIDFGDLPDLNLHFFDIGDFPSFSFINFDTINESLQYLLIGFSQQYLYEVERIKELYKHFDLHFTIYTDDLFTLFDDYNPPQLDLSAFDTYKTATYNYIDNSWTQIQQISKLMVNKTEIFQSKIINIYKSAYTYLFENIFTEWKYADFKGFDIDIDGLLYQLDSIVNLACLFDIIYRIFKVIQQIEKVLLKGNIQIQTINVDKETCNHDQCYINPITKIISLIIPYTIPFLLIIVITLLIISGIIMIYIPFLLNTINGCFISENGTDIGENVYSLAYNYATIQANSNLNSGLNTYDKSRKQYCDYWYDISLNTYNEQIKSIKAFESDYIYFERIYTQLKKCVNLDEIHKNNMNISTKIESLYDQFMPLHVHSLYSDAIYNCSSLPSCYIGCNGPNTYHIHHYATNVSCKAEWFVHSYILVYSLGIIIWILLNIIRFIYLQAIVSLLYKHISGDTYKVNLLVNTNGDIRWVSKEDFSTVIKQKCSKKLSMNQVKSSLLCTVGTLITIITVGFLYYVAIIFIKYTQS